MNSLKWIKITSILSSIIFYAFIINECSFLNAQVNNQEAKQTGTFQYFIVRKGDKLFEGDHEYRFLGLAAPNIQQNESQLKADMSNRFPDEYEIRDLLDGIRREGGLVTRTFSLSVYSKDDREMPVYIQSRRNYNEEAFKCLDKVIAFAHEYNIRLIIPFIASQSFYGIRGVDEFSALSGKPAGSFWTDEEVKSDFKDFLNYILNRKNTVNQILYKNDPAILAWQLGNEFGSYAGDRKLNYDEWSPKILKWSLEMAAYIKTIDSNHLIMEAGGADRKAFLADPNIDIISEHLYEYWNKLGNRPWVLGPLAYNSHLECKGIKPLIIDEFGLGSTENISALMDTIINCDISGGLLWSIRSHRRDGGWYYHNEGGTQVNSYHVPGFATGYNYDEMRILDILKVRSYKIRGIKTANPDVPAPEPVLFYYKSGFTWRGSAGTSFYTVERSLNSSGPWKVIATGLDDSVISDVAKFENSAEANEPLLLFVDETRVNGIKYYYRIKASNEAGDSGYSNIISF